jgi:D-lactate dehydrogenase (cytochrome)
MDASPTLPIQNVPRIHYDITPENLSASEVELSSVVGPDSINTSQEICAAHSGSRWSSAHPSHKTHLVVYPKNTDQVSSILKICSRRRIPVVPYSGGTGLANALAAPRGGICIDFRDMAKIWDLHESDMDVTVQPGVGWQHLNAEMASKGLFFPPDPSPDAKIGGMIAMGCSGTNAYRYGTMKDWIISLTVVLADGTIIKTRNRPRKSSAGYDLTHLLVGSEGTLGVVTEAVIRLTPVPKDPRVAIVSFSDTHLAVQSALSIMSSGVVFDALEFVDHNSLKAVNQSGLFEENWEESPTLFLRFSGGDQITQTHVALIKDMAAKQDGCLNFRLSSDPQQGDAWWSVRKMMGKCLVTVMKPDDIFYTSDAAVPRSRLADIIVETQEAISDIGLFCSTLGHIGDGKYLLCLVYLLCAHGFFNRKRSCGILLSTG